jgi:hypothetical protein
MTGMVDYDDLERPSAFNVTLIGKASAVSSDVAASFELRAWGCGRISDKKWMFGQ